MEAHQGYMRRLTELNAQIGRARLDPDVGYERAAGLLAGRIGCRVEEAHAYLRQLATEQDRDVRAVAAEVMVTLEARAVTPPGRLRTAAAAALTERAQPVVGPGPLDSGIPHDEQTRLAERMAQTERLGSLGWGEWDLVSDTTVWSDELYRIYERDPTAGPLPREESEALALPDDEPVRRQAAEAFGRGETVDVTYRIRVHGRVKHVRAVVDAVRDAGGRPLRIYGIIQDVTARETSRAKLAEVQQQLREHQASLAVEHRLAAQLQQIVLPIPTAPIDLPGIRAAVRYLPAEQASRVGGDWYHAATARDGSVILAVGDVAGHGVYAAATMALLRHALTTLTVTTTTHPAELLAHLNQLLYSSDPTVSTATAVIVRYDPATHHLRWAQAGHPAPLRTRAGVTTELPRPRGPLLGALPHPGYETATHSLGEGDVLVLYTDGLIEHRSHSLEEGLAPVMATLNRVCAAHRPLDFLVAELRTANPDDDTCILAARRSAATGRHDE
ncbi:SpoIIE family protein phosphatase [Actinoplanes sp. ATCC 53533]|uniref:SpoIIE family protein phosphatase n=1 Tax=Actinoplanes sp. ATCC 53533 TaxID=1288362 RepID=UPI0018F6BF52|nr:SpoIIE family protein phosphatase [Actinoplanes sp. ATCC 53533]